MNIRLAHPDSFDRMQVARLLNEYYRADPDPEKERDAIAVHAEATAYLKDPDTAVIIGEEAGVFWGLFIVQDRKDGTVDAGCLYSMGSNWLPVELIRFGLDWAASRGATKARIAVNQRNGYRGFYSRIGFEPVVTTMEADLATVNEALARK